MTMLPGGPGAMGWAIIDQGLGWEPKLAFSALARANWRPAPAAGGEPG